MSVETVARALVGVCLKAAGRRFPSLTRLETIDPALLSGGVRPGPIEFRGTAADERDLLIEVQVRWDYSLDEEYLSPPAAPAVADSAVRDVYAIQFVLYDRRWQEFSVAPLESFRVSDGVSDDGTIGLHTIQIPLLWSNLPFPVPDEIAITWTPSEWWRYFFRCSPRFTAHEILRCQELGMPDEVTQGFEQLNLNAWDEEMQKHYCDEIQTVASDREEMRNSYFSGNQVGRAEGRKAGREEGFLEGKEAGRAEGLLEGREAGIAEGLLQGRKEEQLTGLLRAFLKQRSWDQDDIADLRGRISTDLVRDTFWRGREKISESQSLYKQFVHALVDAELFG
jgi:hypothetical protein